MKDFSLTALSLLTIVFITLKLTDVITWSWYWVLSPTIIQACVYASILGFMLSIHIKKIISKLTNKK